MSAAERPLSKNPDKQKNLFLGRVCVVGMFIFLLAQVDKSQNTAPTATHEQLERHEQRSLLDDYASMFGIFLVGASALEKLRDTFPTPGE